MQLCLRVRKLRGDGPVAIGGPGVLLDATPEHCEHAHVVDGIEVPLLGRDIDGLGAPPVSNRCGE